MQPNQQPSQQTPFIPQPPQLPPSLQPPEPPRKKTTLLLWSVVIGIVVVASAAAVFFVLQQNNQKKPGQQVATDTKISPTKNNPDNTKIAQSTPGETVQTPCYSFTAPKGYRVSADAEKCTVTLTNSKNSATQIKISYLTSDLTPLTNDVIDFVNDRYKVLADEQHITFYKSGHVSMNKYQTGVAYIDSSSKDDKRKKVFYTVLNENKQSKAQNVKLIQAFLINGYADTSAYDKDVRVVVSSFLIR